MNIILSTYLKFLWGHQLCLVHFFHQAEYLWIHPSYHVKEHFEVLLQLTHLFARPCLYPDSPQDLMINDFDLNHTLSVGTHVHQVLLLVVKAVRLDLR